MDGYIITATAEEALAAFGQPGVRHVAALDTGEGFVAFEGERPCAGALMLVSDEALPWWWHKVRTIAPTSTDETECFALIAAAQLSGLSPHVVAATRLASGNILIQTSSLILGAIWSATSTEIRDTRLQLVEV